ncbi:DUF1214 domain-containing protein [Jiangella anatolica]|uniref:Carboxylesterase n=1 Tax=Jiangella anatolica TaxID=2670374 RepID=A0A2W2BAP5_9ACTN|nr:DUF1214 domain-containing protein [Jiangella anatolica]PZF84631.1 carboxylesterase [Jiangella anatolica]
MEQTMVNVDNFARAETERMFLALLRDSGGVNAWAHHRTPTPLDDQPVIRQNRDTLYSTVLADIGAGATLTLPDAGGRYLSAMPINQDGYVNDVFHGAGEHRLDQVRFDTRYVLVAVRALVDSTDPADVAEVNALQDRMRLDAGSAEPFTPPAYDEASFTATREALLALARGILSFDRAFGARGEVDAVRHLIGTAAGWGGLPDREAMYLNVDPGLPASGAYRLTVTDVPVDGFWSISLYGADGYFPRDSGPMVSLNDRTAVRDADGSVTVHFGGDPGLPNRLPLVDGWNYVVRLYRPRAEILDGSWTFPPVTSV